MDSPSGSHIARFLFRFGLLAVLGVALDPAAFASAPPKPRLLDEFLSVDARFIDGARIDAARVAFESLVLKVSACVTDATPSQDRARCVVDALFASDPVVPVAEPGDPESSTVTSVLGSHRGNCAALTAVALAVVESVGVPMEAVVFPRHVVVRAPGNDDRVFELLDRGTVVPMSQIRKRLGAEGAHDTRVRPNAFPAYYLDNLAVRFADAGNVDQAESMFHLAIEAGPRVARIRFNYGTYLLGANQLEPAKEQLRRAVRLDRRNASAWANLGVALARLGDTAEARHSFERALRCEPGNTIAAENLKALTRDGSPARR